MRTWTPRRPSPELRARIFSKPPAPAIEAVAETVRSFSRWLVPAFGCFLLVAGGLAQRPDDHIIFADGAELLGVHNGGNSRVMLAETRQHCEKNAIPAKLLEYHLGARELTQPVSAPLTSYTNQLIQQ